LLINIFTIIKRKNPVLISESQRPKNSLSFDEIIVSQSNFLPILQTSNDPSVKKELQFKNGKPNSLQIINEYYE